MINYIIQENRMCVKIDNYFVGFILILQHTSILNSTIVNKLYTDKLRILAQIEIFQSAQIRVLTLKFVFVVKQFIFDENIWAYLY